MLELSRSVIDFAMTVSLQSVVPDDDVLHNPTLSALSHAGLLRDIKEK
jgi:hypothetical protein